MFDPTHRAALLIPLVLGCAALPARAASFDCARAATWTEQVLCGDATLGALDEHLAAAYASAQGAAQADTAVSERLASEQKAWLAERDGCQLIPCLQRVYERRIAELTGTLPASQRDPLKQQAIQESAPHVSITAVYPVLSGDGAAIASANQEIRALVEEVVDSFRGRLGEYTEAEPDPGGADWEGPDWSLSIDYATPHRTDHYLAIPFTGYEYTGGAHGMPLILPLVIDLSSGRRVQPEGLFAPGSRWVERLSEHCLAELQGRDLLSTDDQWLQEGTAPKPENYSLLFPGPEGLTVTFAPYSVAPYAAGIQEVVIPYAELAGLLNPGLFGD